MAHSWSGRQPTQPAEHGSSEKHTQVSVSWDGISKPYRPPTLVCSPKLLQVFLGKPLSSARAKPREPQRASCKSSASTTWPRGFVGKIRHLQSVLLIPERKENQPKRTTLVPEQSIGIQALCLLLQLCGTPVLKGPPIPPATDKTIIMLYDSLEHTSCPHFPPPPPAFSFLCLGGKHLSVLLLPLSLCIVPTTCAPNKDQMGILVRAWG